MIEKNRQEKLNILKSLQDITYPNTCVPTHTVEDIITLYTSEEDLTLEEFAICGRVMLKRDFGRSSFLMLQDNFQRIQIQIKQGKTEDTSFAVFKSCCDLGDIIWVKGSLCFTTTKELTIQVRLFTLLVKALLPLPDKFRAISDQETIYRQRYLDLLSNKESFDRFIKRSNIISAIRHYMDKLEFIEVETPILHNVASGATAKPFATHHNTLNIPLYLRIAPELYLKQLQVGGIKKVYEINKSFRNEGLSSRHNPEFTMLECYTAYANYKDMINLTQDLIHHLYNISNSTYIELSKPFHVCPLLDLLADFLQVSKDALGDINLLNTFAKQHDIELETQVVGIVQTILFDELISHNLIEPTFVTEYPTDSSPLARKNDHNSTVCDRFELFIKGIEIANAYSELNDPIEQEERLRAQNEMLLDKDYIEALKYGLPPCAGLGIGLDRLVMLLTNAKSIKDVILFPTLKPLQDL